ncbi:TIM barrel protein [Massilia dura]|uniref:TIM barrel protein n=1 Tax=Pseudoduganella dura TaxID=321982 RepID=A0A6I3X8L9_9BURK|nr:TIM barrel protein [Pseudoduganella dura]MUI10970.1 TIM barrel protein [Pseudoduganella dura]GGY13280.1 hydroxypyruvate isomerase [Pseudoduganella dura]
MNFAACIEWMFAGAGDDLASRIRAAHAAGLTGVEIHLWRENAQTKPLDDIERALHDTGVRLRSFCVEPRCSLVDPADHDRVLAAVADAIPVAQRFAGAGMVLASGFTRADVPVQEQFDAVVAVLKRAAALARDAGTVLWLEPVYMVVGGQRMFVDTIGRGLDIVAAVDSPALRLLADVYHSAQTGEDFAAAVGDRMGLVAHVQVADTPGRHEPGTGDIDWTAVMAVLREKGYAGEIGLEYFPSMADAESLAMTRKALGIA